MPRRLLHWLRRRLLHWQRCRPDGLIARPPLAERRQHLGRRSEDLARRFLLRQGYVIEAANVRVPSGELDLVAREGDTLCFVEVRATTTERFGGPLATVDARKQRQVVRAARWYLARRPVVKGAVRFDVVGVTWSREGQPTCELIRGAFEDAGSWD